MEKSLQRLTDLQIEAGYKPGTLNAIAFLGIFGEAGEVLNELTFDDPYAESLRLEAVQVAEKVDDLKKAIRDQSRLDASTAAVQVLVTDEAKLDKEIADLFYYVVAASVLRGKTLQYYLDLSYEKVSAKMQQDITHTYGEQEEPAIEKCPVELLQNLDELQVFVSMYKSFAPKTVLEIGSFYGGTLWYFMRYVKLETLTAVDLPIPLSDSRHSDMISSRELWPRWKEEFMPKGTFNDVQGDSHSLEIVNRVWELHSGKDVDVLHIDGDHSYEGVKADYENYYSLVRPGGMIVFHDVVGLPEVKRFFEEISPNYNKRGIICAENFPSDKRKDLGATPWGIGVLFVPEL